MTNLTKKALADSLKKLAAQRTLEHITVQDIVEDAQVSRNTFYYHFHDVYELMEYLLKDESIRLREYWREKGSLSYALAAAFQYASENRALMLHLFEGMDHADLLRVARTVVYPSAELIFDEAAGGDPVLPEDRRFVLEIAVGAISGVYFSWIANGMEEDFEVMRERIDFFFSDSIQRMVERCVERARQETTD